jgi:hypothetical protein
MQAPEPIPRPTLVFTHDPRKTEPQGCADAYSGGSGSQDAHCQGLSPVSGAQDAHRPLGQPRPHPARRRRPQDAHRRYARHSCQGRDQPLQAAPPRRVRPPRAWTAADMVLQRRAACRGGGVRGSGAHMRGRRLHDFRGAVRLTGNACRGPRAQRSARVRPLINHGRFAGKRTRLALMRAPQHKRQRRPGANAVCIVSLGRSKHTNPRLLQGPRAVARRDGPAPIS